MSAPGRRYSYPLYLRVLTLLPSTFIFWMLFLTALERTPPLVVIVFATLIGCYSIWVSCWLLRGAITVDERGIGFCAWRQEVFLAWSQVERIEYRNWSGQVRLSGAQGEIRFNDHLQGYWELCDTIVARAPERARSLLPLPLILRASLLKWGSLVLVSIAILLAGGIAAINWRNPEFDRSHVVTIGIVAAGFLASIAGSFVREIQFNKSEIAVAYLVRPGKQFEARRLRRIVRKKSVLEGNDGRQLHLIFDDGTKLTITEFQFDQPLEQVVQTLSASYQIQIEEAPGIIRRRKPRS